MQEAGVAEDEVKYGAAARLAQIDSELVDVQQDRATCLKARQAAITEELQTVQSQLATLQVSCCSQACWQAMLCPRPCQHVKAGPFCFTVLRPK